MTPYRVHVTATAQEQIQAVWKWWLRERPAAPELFQSELRRALERLATMPRSGTLYPNPAVSGVRRLLLCRSGYHVYYTADSETRLVVVRAVWHVARGRGPTTL